MGCAVFISFSSVMTEPSMWSVSSTLTAAWMVISCTLLAPVLSTACCISHSTSLGLAFLFSESATTKAFLSVPELVPGLRACTKLTS